MMAVRDIYDRLRNQDPHDVDNVVKVMNAAAAQLQRLTYALDGAICAIGVADMTAAKADVLIYCCDLGVAPSDIGVDEVMSE